MSKDIWHFPSEAPAYCFLCVFENSFDGEVHCGHYNPVKKQFCSTEGRYEINQVKKYCDLLHLLDCEQELIRTRKALEVMKSVLENISSFYKSLILANPVSDINWDVVAKNFAKHSDEALEQITAEQKDK